MDTLLLPEPQTKRAISKIHDDLTQLDRTITLDHLREAWMEDMGVEITETQLGKAQEFVHSSSVCARHGLIQLKILHRLHLSKLRLSKMFPTVDPLCDRCGQAPASIAHMFWNCPRLCNYWANIFKSLSEVLNIQLKPDTVYLGLIRPQRLCQRINTT